MAPLRDSEPDDRQLTWTESAARQDLPAEARRRVRRLLGEFDPTGHTHDVETVLSELVTNAVAHGRPPVTVTVRTNHDRTWLAVIDRGPGGAHGWDDPRSGLGVVHRLTEGFWGTRTDDDGYCVWAVVVRDPAG